jgi:hypothetical protein
LGAPQRRHPQAERNSHAAMGGAGRRSCIEHVAKDRACPFWVRVAALDHPQRTQFIAAPIVVRYVLAKTVRASLLALSGDVLCNILEPRISKKVPLAFPCVPGTWLNAQFDSQIVTSLGFCWLGFLAVRITVMIGVGTAAN